MGWNKDQINRHLGKSVVNSPPNLKIADDGKVSFMTLNGNELPEETDEYGKTRPKAPMISMTESQIAKIVGRSVTKVPTIDETENQNAFNQDNKSRKDSLLSGEEENNDDQVRINMNENGDDESKRIMNGNMNEDDTNRRETGNAEPDTEQNENQPPRAFGYGFSKDQGKNHNIMDNLAPNGDEPGHRAVLSMNQYGNNPILNMDDDVHTGFGSIN